MEPFFKPETYNLVPFPDTTGSIGMFKPTHQPLIGPYGEFLVGVDVASEETLTKTVVSKVVDGSIIYPKNNRL